MSGSAKGASVLMRDAEGLTRDIEEWGRKVVECRGQAEKKRDWRGAAEIEDNRMLRLRALGFPAAVAPKGRERALEDYARRMDEYARKDGVPKRSAKILDLRMKTLMACSVHETKEEPKGRRRGVGHGVVLYAPEI